MRTDHLIAALAADRMQQRPTSQLLLLALLPALLLSLVAYALLIGPRADLQEVLLTPRVAFKLLWSFALFVAAAGFAVRLARPGRASGAWRVAVMLVPVALLVSVCVELLVRPSTQWATFAIGHNSTWCLRLIPLLSLAPLVAALLALRQGAPTRRALTGAFAGLLAGGLGATLYATHCPDDSPLFVACWYVLAIAVVSLLGAILGSRLLRW